MGCIREAKLLIFTISVRKKILPHPFITLLKILGPKSSNLYAIFPEKKTYLFSIVNEKIFVVMILINFAN